MSKLTGGVKSLLAGRDWLPALISYGLPTVLVAGGIVLLVVWSQVGSQVGPPQVRVPGPQPAAPAAPANPAGSAAPTSPGREPSAPPSPPAAEGVPGEAPLPPAPPGAGGLGPPPLPPEAGGMGAPSGAAAPAAAAVTSLPGSWPWFRGPDHDNVFKESVSLARAWPAGGPKKLWQIKLGEGYAGAAVRNSRVYVLDYDQTARRDNLRCFALADGQELWHASYPVEVKRNHGMSRTVPAVTDKYVVSLGPKCHVMCCDAVSGKVLWKIDMVQKWGTKVPQWYAGQCPLIDGSRVILAPGGKALMAAVDLASGKVLWETPNPQGWKMTHASIIPAAIGGQKVFLWPASDGVVGISPDGKLLWETTDWKVSTATVPCAIPIGDGRVFLCGGYNSGAIMFKLTPQGGGFTSEVLYRLKATVFGSEQQTPILYQGHIYGVITGGQLVCLSLDGRQLWTSGATRKYGLGPYVIAGGLMYLIDDQGNMTLAQISPQAFKPLATAKVLAGPDAWGPIALAGTRLICRDLTSMVCLDVSGR